MPFKYFNWLFKYLCRLKDEQVNASERVRLRLLGVKLPKKCQIGKCVSISLGFSEGSIGQISLAENVSLEQGVILNAWGGKIAIQENVFIGPYAVIYGHGGVMIGCNSLVSMHCCILSSNHAVPEVSQAIRSKPDILLPTKIGSDVWLGANVTVLGGVTIGDGCVVGAGAVVTKDLPPYSISVGVPAQVVKMRVKGAVEL
jgi:acetyltransferase-like isoleucine patch superfamily enzyme